MATPETVVAKDQTPAVVVEDKLHANGIQQKADDRIDGEKEASGDQNTEKGQQDIGKEAECKELEDKAKKKKDVAVEVEPKTGVSFPVKMDDGKQLLSTGLRKKSMLGMGIKVYGFGMYADNEKMKDLMKSKIGKAPEKPTKEMYQAVIDSDVPMTVRLVIVFSSLTMNMVKKNFDEGIGAAIKKLNDGKKNDELANKVMGQASDNIKLSSGSVFEITRYPGYTLETKALGEVVSNVESELLCRAFLYMYIGDDPFDKDAKEKLGMSLLSLF